MAKHRKTRTWPPKGSFPLPNGDHVYSRSMVMDGRRLRITAQIKAKPDIDKLARAYVMLAKQLAADGQLSEKQPRRRSGD